MAIFVSAIFHEKFPMVWYEWNVINNCVMQQYFWALTLSSTHMGTIAIVRENKLQESTRKSANAFREDQIKQKNASAQYKRHTLFRNSMFAASCDEIYTVNHLQQLTKPLTATSTGAFVTCTCGQKKMSSSFLRQGVDLRSGKNSHGRDLLQCPNRYQKIDQLIL